MNDNLTNNLVKAEAFAKSLEKFLSCDTLVLKGVKVNYSYVDGKKTDSVDSISYNVVDPETYSLFTIKVPATIPVISEKELEKAEQPIYISIPLKDSIVKPYKIEYGKVKVSIQVPYVEIAENIL